MSLLFNLKGELKNLMVINVTVTAQDGKLTFNPETGRWEDEDGNVGWGHKKVCPVCNKPKLDINGVSDCDFCLQALTSCDFIDNACCGHGVDKNAYISLKDGRRFVLDTTSKEVANKLNKQPSTIEQLQEEIEELKRERDGWKSSTCSYMNKDSILSMDCQIVREALWELEKEIEFGSKREDLFFDLKEKFEKLNNHRIGVF